MNAALALCALLAVSVPLAASGRSACETTSDQPGKKGLTFCTTVNTAAECDAEAARRGSAAWVQAHPPKLTEGVPCRELYQKELKASAEAKKGAPAAAPTKRATAAKQADPAAAAK